VAVDADQEVTITPGATEAIFCAIQAVIHPGDEVIVFDPCYDSYEPSVELAGGRCVHVQLSDGDFRIDWQKFSDALSPRTRMVILNSPHNPSGALISRDDLDQLAALMPTATSTWSATKSTSTWSTTACATPACWPTSSCTACLRGQLVRQDLPRHRLEDRLRGRAAGAERRAAQGAPVRQLLRRDAAAVRLADFMAEHPEHIDELPAFYQAKRDLFCDLLAARVSASPARRAPISSWWTIRRSART
jgi:methionine aminotransferase